MISRRALPVTIVVVTAMLLSGCAMFEAAGDLFGGGKKKSNLKGERVSVMSTDESVKPDAALAQTPVVLPAPYKNDAWPNPGGYASNAMYHLEANGPLREIWRQDAGKGSSSTTRITAPPIVADGKIFVLDAEVRIRAFDASNGSVLWETDLAPESPGGFTLFGLIGEDMSIDATKGFGGGSAFDDGKLFVATGFGEVFAINPATGKVLWKTKTDTPIGNPPVANGGRVFVSTQDNHFYALAQDNGRKLWDHQGIQESAGILAGTSAAVSGEYVLAPYTSGELYALRVQNGRPAWSDMLTRSGTFTALSELDDIAGKPVIDRDMVFAISHSGIMTAINLNNGERVWTRDVGGIQAPWVAGDFLYVLTTNAELLCLRRADGKVKWIKQLPRWQDMEDKEDPILWSGPVLMSNRLVLASSSGEAISISPYTGDVLGRMEIPDGTFIPPVVANGTMYILTNDADLVAYR